MNKHIKILPQCAEKFDRVADDINEMKGQLLNHIPSLIKELSEKIDKRPSWSVTLILGALLGIVMFLLGVILK